VETESAVRAWVDAWERGWRSQDPQPIVERYAERCLFLSHPFRGPEAAGAYVERVLAEEEAEPEVWFGEPVVTADRAAVEYWATLHVDGGEHTLAGSVHLRFDTDGLVVEHRDFWAMEPGRRHRHG
jgi:ketosteroid isomerase-like protein